jgi:hypothetical protein
MAEWVREGPYSVGPNSMAYPDRLIQILSEADAQKNNLRWAQAAVTEAKNAVRAAGSGNKAGDILRTLGGSFIGIQFTRKEWRPKVKGDNLPRLRELSAAARKHGVGNCGELSAIAFIYLLDRRITVSLDWMGIDGADHQFVLLDRAKGSDESDPNTWGERCVIADPWKDVVMPGAQIERLDRVSFRPGAGDNELWPQKVQSYVSYVREEA